MWNMKTKLNKIVDKTQPIIRKGVEKIQKSIKEKRDKQKVMREIEIEIENARLDKKGIGIMKMSPNKFTKKDVREFVRNQEKKAEMSKRMKTFQDKPSELKPIKQYDIKPYNIMGDNQFTMKKPKKKSKNKENDFMKSIF